MPDGTGEITIERGLDQIKQGLSAISAESRIVDKDLRAVNAALRLDPTNTTLLAEKQRLLGEQLRFAEQRSRELKDGLDAVNTAIKAGEQPRAGQIKQIETYSKELDRNKYLIDGLTGAINNQSKAQETAAVTTKTFSQSMTEFQSNLRAVNQVMSGLSSAFTLLGGDKDSAMGKALQQGQQVIQTMSGLASLGKLLKNQNILTAGSFSNLALAAGAAFGAFTLVDGLLNGLTGTTRTVAGAIATLTGLVVAGAVAWMAYHGTMTMGVAIPVILAALAVGAAGIKALTTETTAATDALSDVTSTVSSISTPSVSSIPTYSGGTSGVSTTYISQGGLTEGQMEMASYRGFMRAIIESGINEKQFVGSLDVNGRQFAEVTFNDFIDVNDRRTRGFATK